MLHVYLHFLSNICYSFHTRMYCYCIILYTLPGVFPVCSWEYFLFGSFLFSILFLFLSSVSFRFPIFMGRDSAVGIATGYGLVDQRVRVRVPFVARIFTSPCRPDRLWGPPSLLSNGYRGTFLGGKVAEERS
jgi:hypothetical protein